MPHPFSESILNRLLKKCGQEDFVLLETTRITNEEHCSLLFTSPVSHLTLTSKDNAWDFLAAAQDFLNQGYYLAGWLSYEFGYQLEPCLAQLINHDKGTLLADLGVYQHMERFDHNTPSSPPTEHTDPTALSYSLDNVHVNLKKEEYLQAISAIKKYIAAGDTYQVNYTLKLLFDFAGSPLDLYRFLRRNQSVCYGAYIKHHTQHIMSFSPELFFHKKGNTCTVRPMKGTIKRGRTVAEDEHNVSFLRSDSKNKSENVMIVDLLRNDLGRLAKAGSVRVDSLFDIERYETLHQMTSTIRCELRQEVTLADLFKALFPCGSVTGAPKIRTMEIIAELEKNRRGVYTGAIGYLAPSGDAHFNVPIRTVVLDKNSGEMGIGSGIVYDSEGESEWQECLLKSHFLTHSHAHFQLIETILWQPQTGFWMLNAHLHRLQESAHYFDFHCDLRQVRHILQQEAGKAKFQQSGTCQRVRVLLAQDGQLSVTSTPCDPPNFTVSSQSGSLPLVMFSAQHTDSSNPMLFHKTTLRDFYNREREKAVNAGCYEVLFFNEKEEVTEGAISTIFIKKNGVFYTPPLHCGLLPGIFRSFFIKDLQENIVEKILYRHDIDQADALYVANSVRGITEVSLPCHAQNK